MNIALFSKEFMPYIKEPTIRNKIKKEALILEELGIIKRKKILSQYRTKILQPNLLKDFLILDNVELESLIEKFKLDKEDIEKFIKNNKQSLLKNSIIEEDITGNFIVKRPQRFLKAYIKKEK